MPPWQISPMLIKPVFWHQKAFSGLLWHRNSIQHVRFSGQWYWCLKDGSKAWGNYVCRFTCATSLIHRFRSKSIPWSLSQGHCSWRRKWLHPELWMKPQWWVTDSLSPLYLEWLGPKWPELLRTLWMSSFVHGYLVRHWICFLWLLKQITTNLVA